MSARGSAIAVALATLSAVPRFGWSADAPVDVVDRYERTLPVPPEPWRPIRGDEPVPTPRCSTVVVDDETGRPIAGALVTAYADDLALTLVRFDRSVGERTTDAQGVADVTPSAPAGQWVVTADGYAPRHDDGPVPAALSRLERSHDVSVRVVDPFERPVANASIESFLGGSRAPPLGRTTTDADGRAVVSRVGRNAAMRLWVSAPGLAHTVGSCRVGDEPHTIRLPWGRRLAGRVRGADGKPLAGAVVRHAFPRGPAAISDADGQFVLDGMPADDPVLLLHPGAIPDELVLDRWSARAAADVPLDVILTAKGIARPSGNARLDVRIHVGDVVPDDVRALPLVVVRPDGVYEVHSIPRDGSGFRAHAVPVPFGPVRLREGGAFDPVSFAPRSLEVVALAVTPVEIEARWKPRLVVEGLRADATRPYPIQLSVTTETDARFFGFSTHTPVPFVPIAGRIDVVAEERGWRAAGEAMPIRDGARVVTLGAAIAEEPYRGRRRESREVSLDVVRADGRAVDAVDVEHHPQGAVKPPVKPPIRVRAATTVRLQARGLQPLFVRVGDSARQVAVWPAGGIVVTVEGAGDRPCRALLDGALHDVVDGTLDVRGLAAGEHSLVVSPVDGSGVLWRFRLAEGQVLRRSLTLPAP